MTLFFSVRNYNEGNRTYELFCFKPWGSKRPFLTHHLQRESKQMTLFFSVRNYNEGNRTYELFCFKPWGSKRPFLTHHLKRSLNDFFFYCQNGVFWLCICSNKVNTKNNQSPKLNNNVSLRSSMLCIRDFNKKVSQVLISG